MEARGPDDDQHEEVVRPLHQHGTGTVKKNMADYWAKNHQSTYVPFLSRLFHSVFSLLFPVYFTPVILVHQCDCRMVLNRGARGGQFLMRYVLAGITIVFDCWRAYNTVGLLGYRHLTVNHNLDFVDPITGACTNHVECYWKNDKMHNIGATVVRPRCNSTHISLSTCGSDSSATTRSNSPRACALYPTN